MKKFDAIMIGFGKGSKTLALDLAKQGKRVAMIEKSQQMYGGTCINEGCIPSKSLIVQAEKYDYQSAIANKENLITKLRQKNFEKLDQFNNLTIYTATAQFVSDHEIHIQNDKQDEIIYGEYIFINTGASSIVPDIAGIYDTKHIYLSAEIMKQKQLPNRLAIIGGGYIGLEMASMYARYGSEVTVFESGHRLVKREDQDVSKVMQDVLEKQGVNFSLETNIKAFYNDNEEVIIIYEDKCGHQYSATFDAVLLATGRQANTKQLGLSYAGVNVDRFGNVIVNEHLQTNVSHIYAMGDVKGGQQFTYISLDDYRIVKDHLYGEGKRTTQNRGQIAYSVFISPTFSRVGLNAYEAKQLGYQIKIAQMPASAIPRAHVVNQTNGILKAIIDTKTDRILGCTLFCEESEEMINFMTLVMNQNLPYQVVRDHIFTHPTMLEALNDLFMTI